jgi:hypothetical protein
VYQHLGKAAAMAVDRFGQPAQILFVMLSSKVREAVGTIVIQQKSSLANLDFPSPCCVTNASGNL